jgi:threonine synthase
LVHTSFGTQLNQCATSAQEVGQEGAATAFKEAVLLGWAHDGGMLLPELLPAVDSNQLAAWRKLTYPALCEAVLRLFMSGDDLPDLQQICERAFSTFGVDEVVKVVQLPAQSDQPFYLLELWHGPTLAFKDLGMQVLCQALQSLLTQNGAKGRRTVLVSTSGDTGPSALAAVRDAPALHCVVLYPIGRVSRVQEAQLLCERHAANTTVVACEGTSDDMDIPCLEVRHFLSIYSSTKSDKCSALYTVRFKRVLW